MEFTHFNEQGRAKMVDVTEKAITTRVAVARGEIHISSDALYAIKKGKVRKGDTLAVAQVAAVMAAKNTSSIIPMCHNIPLTSVDVSFEYTDYGIEVFAKVKCTAKTGVEMEALHAVSVACLTIYDMVKAIDKKMTINNIELVKKTGGSSGDFTK
ncbi:MAG: cyclic pyranopterin monophosphate synthase MoaC [Clostridiales bacterium]|jgi:cyclic pyranopterin phosphate synthase|nr:cyclic pyranopterin monophosphate synthase MoaC [Clostridiales bacterium]